MDRLQDALLTYGLDAGLIIAAADADPEFAAAQALAGAMHLFRMTCAGEAEARPFLARAQRAAAAATPRERHLIAAIAAWADRRITEALRHHRAILRLAPGDLVSARIAQFHLVNRGDFRGLRALTTALLSANGHVPHVLGMHAFALEQTGAVAEAEQLARAAAEQAFDPWAEHALAHALDSRGAHRESIAWLTPRAGRWRGCSSFLRTHNFWHLALAHLASGQRDAALALWDAEVWGVRPDHVQDQLNAISLLAHLERAGLDVGDRWQRMGPHLAGNSAVGISAFADLHLAYGLARAGEGEALARLMAALDGRASAARAPALARVTARAARALSDHGRGRAGPASRALAAALPALRRAGGSSMQQQFFERLAEDMGAQWAA
jgi:tetratricopeptide (TPR) repeat protein